MELRQLRYLLAVVEDAGFTARYPAVEISLTEAAPEQLVEELRLGQQDLVLVGAVPVPQGVAVQVVADEALVAAVAPDPRWPGATASPPGS